MPWSMDAALLAVVPRYILRNGFCVGGAKEGSFIRGVREGCSLFSVAAIVVGSWWKVGERCWRFSFANMGRGRGKGKKLTVVTSHDDPGSGGEETLPAHKRRGRPQKPLKDDIDEEAAEKIEEEDGENAKTAITSKEMKGPAAAENGKKRKKNSQMKENPDSVKEENGVGTRSTNDSTKSNGFRQNGSRRKSKPRRAAEAGVECK
ncbi:hypothetical protein HHK36_019850 [Tetracentron sinense]|uniref:Uncharacterized protein n=1 Tax=Tetracentron sinense TaxID=13715 RepID=A0A834YYA4_TETSI|nr:hypothetical protein HHK36_019850 [Tetracentron sinense]